MKLSKEFVKAFFNSPVAVFAAYVVNLLIVSALDLALDGEPYFLVSLFNFLGLIFTYSGLAYLAMKYYKTGILNPGAKLWKDYFSGDQYVLTIGFSKVSNSACIKTEGFVKDVGVRIKTTLRDRDSFHHDGELFIVIIRNVNSIDQVRFICKRLTKMLNKPYIVDGEQITVKSHIGAAKLERHRSSRDTKASEDLMFRARLKDNDCMLDDRLLVPCSRKSIRTMSTDMKNAISNKQMRLYFLPKIDFKTRKLVGVEALLRWHHPQLGILSPKQFLNYIDKKFHVEITNFVIYSAAKSKASLNSVGINVPISINLFSSDLFANETITALIEAIDYHQLLPGSLAIEISELIMADEREELTKMLVTFNELGVQISLDNFQLAQLTYILDHKIPVSEIKLDKNLVIDEIAKKGGWTALKSAIDVSHNYGARVVVDKIDDEQAYELIKQLGMDAAQGYLISQPKSLEELITEYKISA